jgi:hypothetical protein
MISFLLDSLDSLLYLLPGIQRKRQRRREWTGTVEAKRTWSLSKHAYLVIFRTEDGQRIKIRLDKEEDFDIYEEGRRYTKRAGQVLPDATPTA